MIPSALRMAVGGPPGEAATLGSEDKPVGVEPGLGPTFLGVSEGAERKTGPLWPLRTWSALSQAQQGLLLWLRIVGLAKCVTCLGRTQD